MVIGDFFDIKKLSRGGEFFVRANLQLAAVAKQTQQCQKHIDKVKV